MKNEAEQNKTGSGWERSLPNWIDKETGKAVKTGISSGKKTKAGKSYKANSQVNRWNRQAGKQKFDSRVVEDVPAGPNARQKALNAERANAQKLRNQGEIDPQYHKRP